MFFYSILYVLLFGTIATLHSMTYLGSILSVHSVMVLATCVILAAYNVAQLAGKRVIAGVSTIAHIAVAGLSGAISTYLVMMFPSEGYSIGSYFNVTTIILMALAVFATLEYLLGLAKTKLDAIDSDEDEPEVPDYPTKWDSSDIDPKDEEPAEEFEPIATDIPEPQDSAPDTIPVPEIDPAPEVVDTTDGQEVEPVVNQETKRPATRTQAHKLLTSKSFVPVTFPGSRVIDWRSAASFYLDLRYIYKYKSHSDIAALAEDYGISARTAGRLVEFIDKRIDAAL